MDEAERLLNTHPDSALQILNSITPIENNREFAARYALLKSIALDKNYIDTTTFEVLQPALDYYLENGNWNEKFRTLYYQGRIYQNQGNYEDALNSFITADEYKDRVSDSLLLAHNYVAKAILYFKQYKITEYINNHLEAAKLYHEIGKNVMSLKSYANAMSGYVIQNNKLASDSILSLSVAIYEKCPEGEYFFFTTFLTYILEYGTTDEIRQFLSDNQNAELSRENAMNFAYGYAKIGQTDLALRYIDLHNIGPDISDTLKYLAIKTEIYDNSKDYKKALEAYRDYVAYQETNQADLMSRDLLFVDQRHKIEMDNIVQLQKRDRIILTFLCSVLLLLLVISFLYFINRINKSRRIIAEKENDNLRLNHEILIKNNEKIILERDKKELEAANLTLEKIRLKQECDNLKELLQQQKQLSSSVRDIINSRLNILNSLLAKEITRNSDYAKPYSLWIDSIKKNKLEFMNSTRLAFTASNPNFIKYLEDHNLTIDQINYLCLYAIGLRGKEVGEYIELKRHYNISSDIRKKLGIDEHDTNIGIYIRKLMKELDS